MPIHLLPLLQEHWPTMAKIGAAHLKDPAMKMLGMDALSKGLRRTNEAFLGLLEGEYNRTEEYLKETLRRTAVESFTAFVRSEAVQVELATAFSDETSFNPHFLSRLWKEVRDSQGQELIPLPSQFDWQGIGARYVEAVHRVLADSPELRPIWQARNVEDIKHAIEQMRGPAPPFDLEAYRRSINETFGTLKLSAMRADWDPNARDQAVKLQKIYITQNVKEAFPPRELSRDYLKRVQSGANAVGTAEETKALAQAYAKAPLRPVLDVITDPLSERIVILADPGLGKSTLLQHVALQWANKEASTVTFLIELRKYTRDHTRPRNFLEFLENGSWSSGHLPKNELDRYLRQEPSLFLFDGLDEIFDDTLRGNIVSEITQFARDYKLARIIVTTRVVGYVDSPNPESFQHAGFRQFTLQDFDDSQIKAFIQGWYASAMTLGQKERDELTARLTRVIEESRSVRELAGNPLLLTMMALLNRTRRLPNERVQLYDECAKLLVDGWDAARHLEGDGYLSQQDKLEMLQRIAFKMQGEQAGIAGNMISAQKLKPILVDSLVGRMIANAPVVADRIIDGLAERDYMLCFAGDQQYAFVHRTFLEYFCAKEYKAHLENAEGPKELLELFQSKRNDEAWHEVLRLICAMVGTDFAARLISDLLSVPHPESSWRATFLAADCLSEIRQPGRVLELRETVRGQLIRIFEEARSRSTSILRWFSVSKEVGALQRICRGWPDELTRQWLFRLLAAGPAFSVENVKGKTTSWFGAFWSNFTTLPAPFVYGGLDSRIAEELVRGWHDDTTRQWLMDHLKDPAGGVRLGVLQALSMGWKGEASSILADVKDRLLAAQAGPGSGHETPPAPNA